MLYKPESWLEWAYVGVVVTQALISLSIEWALFYIFGLDTPATDKRDKYDATIAITTLLSILIFAWMYLLVLLYDTLATRNIYQIMSLPIYSLVVIIVLVMQAEQVHSLLVEMAERQSFDMALWGAVHRLLISASIAPAIMIIPQVVLTIHLRQVFGGDILEQLNAGLGLRRDVSLRRDLRWVESCFALLKLDMFFLPVSAISLTMVLGTRAGTEQSITIAVLPFIVIGIWCGFYTVRRERKMGTIAVLVVIALYVAGLLYKMVNMYNEEFDGPYLGLRKVLTFVASVSLLACVLTFVILCRCTSAYGKGLRPYLTMSKKAYEDELIHDLNLQKKQEPLLV